MPEKTPDPDLVVTKEEPLGRPVAAGLPDQIGPYRILKILGEGGMGRVFLAEQVEPVRRRVALKLIHSSLRTPQATLRFDAY